MPDGGEPNSDGGKPGGGASNAGSHTGGVNNAGSATGGSSSGDAGMDTGGTNTGGTNTGGTSTMAGGEGGGAEPSGCTSSRDCDDTIDCTKDACGPGGVCTHSPDDTKCDASRCEACVANVGCVEGETEQEQLLVDPSFDMSSTDWDQTSDRFGKNIFADAAAQSGTNIAKFGPAAAAAKEQEYADLLQYVTIPEGVVALTLTGYYKLAAGTKDPANDYVAVGFWDPGSADIMPVSQFHSFSGNSGAKPAWTAFTYKLSGVDLDGMPGNEFTFDLVANTWDSVYQFDTLAVQATTCK